MGQLFMPASDVNINISDVVTNDSTALKHGFLPKLSGIALQYLNGLGQWVAASGQEFITGVSVANYAALPAAATNTGLMALVLNNSGIWLINFQSKGIYISDGVNWNYQGDYVVTSTADHIANTPAGTITATDIQATVNQLDALKEPTVNKSTTLVADSASNIKFPSVKSVYDWVVAGFALVAGSSAQVFQVSAATVAAHAVPLAQTIGANLIINGGFTINQRTYVSAAVLAATYYGHDRWKAGAGGGDYSFVQLASNTLITIAASKTLIQVIEDKNVQGIQYILSWTGTARARYAVNSAIPAGAYAASPIIITGQTAGATMSIEFGNGALSGTLGAVQLEQIVAGQTAATTFEQRGYVYEFILCQRYYINRTYALLSSLGTAVLKIAYATNTLGSLEWGVTMRATPTVVISSRNNTANKVSARATGADAGTTVVTSTASPTGCVDIFDSLTGFTIGAAYEVFYTADAEL